MLSSQCLVDPVINLNSLRIFQNGYSRLLISYALPNCRGFQQWARLTNTIWNSKWGEEEVKNTMSCLWNSLLLLPKVISPAKYGQYIYFSTHSNFFSASSLLFRLLSHVLEIAIRFWFLASFTNICRLTQSLIYSKC